MIKQYRYIMALVYIFAHTNILRPKGRGINPGEIQEIPQFTHFFSLCAIILSTPTRFAGAKSTGLYFFDDKIQYITRGLIKWLICSIGRGWNAELLLAAFLPVMRNFLYIL
jgi:hypothetical protein